MEGKRTGDHMPSTNGSMDRDNRERLAAGLGWFSIGLGLVEVAAPGALARLIGIRDEGRCRVLLRGLGLREIAAGIGILTRRKPAGWLWGRVAGDLMDLSLLGLAYTSPSADRARVTSAAASVAGVTALDVLCATDLSDRSDAWRLLPQGGPVKVTKAISVNRPVTEVYRFWRDFQNFPHFMKHLEVVEVDGPRSRWVATAPGGSKIAWDAEITADVPEQQIAWRSLSGAPVDNAGQVRFHPMPGGRGTMVRVEMEYSPPAGRLGSLAAFLIGEDPSQKIQEDLRRFKRVLETGEVITTEGQPAARATSISRRFDRAVRGQPIESR